MSVNSKDGVLIRPCLLSLSNGLDDTQYIIRKGLIKFQ